MPQEPYTREEVVRICEALKKQQGFTSWYQRNIEREDLIERRTSVGIHGIATELEHRSPSLKVHEGRFASRIDAASLDLEVAARSNQDADIQSAQRAKNFYYALWYDWLRPRLGRFFAPKRRGISQQVRFGMGVWHLNLVDNLRDLLTGKKDLADLLAAMPEIAGNPFVLECPDLGAVFWEPDFSAVAEVGDRTVSQVLAAYGGYGYDRELGFRDLTSETLELDTAQQNWDEKVKTYHLETGEYIYDVIEHARGGEGYIFEYRPCLIGRPWYAFIPGLVNASRPPEDMFEPLIGPLYPLVQDENIFRTLLNSGALNLGRPMYQQVQDGARGSNYVDIQRMPQDQRPHIIFDTSEQILPKPAVGSHWEPVAVPSPEWIMSALNENSRRQLEVGFPVALAPDAPASGEASSGSQYTKQLEAADYYLKPPLENVAQAVQELFLMAGDAIRALGQPVKITMRQVAQGSDQTIRQAVTVQPDDFKEQDMVVQLESILQSAQYGQNEANIRLMQENLKSRTAVMKEMHENPEAEKDQILLDRASIKVEDMAIADVEQAVALLRPELIAQILAEENVPLPPVAEQPGGPAPGEQFRQARPEGNEITEGLGQPLVNPADQVPVGVVQ